MMMMKRKRGAARSKSCEVARFATPPTHSHQSISSYLLLLTTPATYYPLDMPAPLIYWPRQKTNFSRLRAHAEAQPFVPCYTITNSAAVNFSQRIHPPPPLLPHPPPSSPPSPSLGRYLRNSYHARLFFLSFFISIFNDVKRVYATFPTTESSDCRAIGGSYRLMQDNRRESSDAGTYLDK